MTINADHINALRQSTKTHLDELEAAYSGDDIAAFHATLATADEQLAAIMGRLGLGTVKPLDGTPKT